MNALASARNGNGNEPSPDYFSVAVGRLEATVEGLQSDIRETSKYALDASHGVAALTAEVRGLTEQLRALVEREKTGFWGTYRELIFATWYTKTLATVVWTGTLIFLITLFAQKFGDTSRAIDDTKSIHGINPQLPPGAR